MSAKKGKGAKVHTAPPDGGEKASSFDHMDSPNLSVIDRASFLEGLQLNYGNPLHSTAMEEDLDVLEEGRKDIPQMLKTGAKQRGAAVKRKGTETNEENVKEEKKKKRSRRSSGEKVKARHKKVGERKEKNREPEGERAESDGSAIPQTSNQPNPKAHRTLNKLVGKKPAKGRSVGKTSAARPLKSQQMKKDTKRASESGSEKSSDPQSQESDTVTAHHSRRRVLSSEEEVDEDMSWKPSPDRAKVYSFGRTRKSSSDGSKSRKSSSDGSKSRKSSSGRASSEPEQANADKQRKKRHGRQGGTDLEVVLDTFLEFCDQYRESVESKAVKQSIDSFTSNVKEQLLEKIASYKELRVLKRENAKVGSLIRTKTQRLLDAKHELMRAERQVWLLQKEKAELKLRLSDLRRSHAFLHDIGELNQQYLDYRHKHPKEKETYGASSLPALLWETKHVHAAEHQLRGINNRMEKRLKENGT
ncbi:centromere protein U isoform X2 [Toxotes jaculatrix]|uniref:centromere protein U isoform X2 n=1 Tax=Toxotes jaculatrix TaxID=941984 RepID=UPI001B3AFFB4|nr:centromere protein U isoform X2 [Toxotes jaculatrix]